MCSKLCCATFTPLLNDVTQAEHVSSIVARVYLCVQTKRGRALHSALANCTRVSDYERWNERTVCKLHVLCLLYAMASRRRPCFNAICCESSDIARPHEHSYQKWWQCAELFALTTCVCSVVNSASWLARRPTWVAQW